MARRRVFGAVADAGLMVETRSMSPVKMMSREPIVEYRPTRRNPQSGTMTKDDADVAEVKALAEACEESAARAGILSVVG